MATTSSRAPRHLPGHVGEQRHRVGVGPLHVVEDEHEPGVLGDRGEEAGDGVEEREPVALDGLAGQLGRQPRDRAEPGHRRGGAVGPDQRRARTAGPAATASTRARPRRRVQPPHSTGTARAPGERGQLLGEPRLADPGLAREHRGPAPAVERRVEQRDELGQLVGPPHEPRLHGAEPYRGVRGSPDLHAGHRTPVQRSP